MVSTSTTIAVCVTLFISLILPIAALIVYAVKNRRKGIWSAWLLGAVGFFVLQIVIRTHVLSILSANSDFISFANNNYILYCLILALSAGLFETIARYAVAKIMSRNLTFERGFAAGMGHGGIESMLIIGMTYISNLVYIILINAGEFDPIVQQAAALGADTSGLLVIKDTLINSDSVVFYLAGYERILTMILHIALTLLMCYFVKNKKGIKGIGLCLVLHGCVDFVSLLINGLSTDYLGGIISTTTSYVITYIFLTAVAILSVVLIRYLYKHWSTEEKTIF